MDVSEATAAWLAENLPDGALPIGYMAQIDFVDPDTGQNLTVSLMDCEETSVPKALGMLEMAKMDLMGFSGTGPFDPAWADDE